MSELGSVTALIREAKAGNVEAVAALRQRLGPLMRARAASLLSDPVRRTVGDAEDVEASVGADFFTRPDKLAAVNDESRRHLEAILRKAVGQKVIEYRRKANVRIQPVRESEMVSDDSSSSPDIAVAGVSAEQLAADLAEQIEGLPAEHLELVMMLLEDRSIRDIARERDVTRYQIEQQLQQIGKFLEGR